MRRNVILHFICSIVFPYCKEIDGLIRFYDQLNFDITNIYDYRLSGKVGMYISTQKQFSSLEAPNYCIKDIENANWNDQFDTVIMGYTDKIEDASKIDYKKYIISKCLKYNKNIYMFDYNSKYDEYLTKIQRAGLQVYYPHILETDIPKNRFGKMYRNSIPIVGIFGMSSHQGKLTLQLELIKLLSQNYTVSSIGTESTAALFNMDYCFPMGYHSTVETKSYDSVYLLNNAVHDKYWKSF